MTTGNVFTWAIRTGPGMSNATKARPREGFKATIHVPPGGHLTSDQIVAATKRIASAYRVPATNVVIEPWPDGSEHLARLMVFTGRNPLHVPLPYPDTSTLDQDTGRITIGTHATGLPAAWQLRVPGSGACNGMIVGCPGAGKSRLVDGLLIALHTSDRDVAWAGDTQGGASIPDWQNATPVFAPDVPSIRRMMAGAMAALAWRQQHQAGATWTDDKGRERSGLKSFTATPEYPQLTIIIEEAADALKDDYIRECCKVIAQKGRKVGIAVVIVTQVPSLDELGGGGVALRSMLSGFNVVSFRTADRYSGNMASAVGFPVDPCELPKFWPDGSPTAGLGFLAAAGSNASYMRAWDPGDPYDYAEHPAAGTLDAGTAEAAQDAMDAYDRDRAAAATPKTERPSTATTAPPAWTPTVDPAATNPEKVRAVLTAAEGPLTTGVIAKRADIELARASETLKRLSTKGEVEALGAATWQIAA